MTFDGPHDERAQGAGEAEPPIPSPMMEFPADKPRPIPSPMMEFPAPQPPTFPSPRLEFPATGPAIAAPDAQRKNHAWVIYSAIAGVVVLVVIGAVAVFSTGGHGDSSQTPTSAAPLPNTGPFTGTYTAAMGPETDFLGTPGTEADAAGFSETWSLRSACSTNGCVATASTGGRFPTKDPVFDDVGGRWLAVSNSRRKCGNHGDDEAWNVILVQPQADGTMSGEWLDVTTTGCFRKRTLTFTRTADADISLLPDPAKLPPRVVSKAEALHGRYDSRITYAAGNAFSDHESGRTDCLRTGDRCVSSFVDANGGGESFVFANGAWTRNQDWESSCPSGGTYLTTVTATLPLPQPPQNPIPSLAGHGYTDVRPETKCGKGGAFDETLTRTGD
jgi:hypothetical protein